ncbi:hypothetical protein D3C76_1257780 [compost metagenome]
MGVEELSAVAGRGYFKGEEILACHEAGIIVFVSTEMSLHVLAYNLKRMMSIFDIQGLLEAIRA